MKSSVDNIIYRELNQGKINILYCPYDGIFEQTIEDLGNFYIIENQIYSTNFNYNKNFCFMEWATIPNRIDIDLVICNHSNQLDTAIKFSSGFHAPLLYIEHEIIDGLSEKQIKYLTRNVDRNVKRVFTNRKFNKYWYSNEDVFGYDFPEFDKTKTIDISCCGNCNIGKKIDLTSPMSFLKKVAQSRVLISEIESPFITSAAINYDCLIIGINTATNKILNKVVIEGSVGRRVKEALKNYDDLVKFNRKQRLPSLKNFIKQFSKTVYKNYESGNNTTWV